jgi:hypothetical protein
MQRDASVPSTLVSVIEASLILAVVGVQAIRARRAARAPLTTRDAERPA